MNTLGIDVSKNTLDCCILVHNEPYYHTFKNDNDGFFSLLSLFNSFKVHRLGFESTGNYHKKLEKYLFDNGVKPYILRPISISNFRKVINMHGKSDKTDSYSIAYFLFKGDLTEYLSFPVRDVFTPLLNSISMIDKQIRQNKNLIHSLELYPSVSPLLDDFREISTFLNIKRNKLEQSSLDLLYEMCPESFEIKNEISGVGDKLLLNLIPYLYDNFDSFTLKQINTFFGLNPIPYQSGSSVFKKDKLSKKGNPRIKKSLYMSSVSAVRNNEILKAKYLRLRESGKPSKLALVSVMSHLLRAIVIKLSIKTNRPYKK